jgi:hypothetical protein
VEELLCVLFAAERFGNKLFFKNFPSSNGGNSMLPVSLRLRVSDSLHYSKRESLFTAESP